MTDLSTLLERVRAATGGDRELDAEIWLALNTGTTRKFSLVKSSSGARPDYTIETRDSDFRLVIIPAYTSSLDASVELCERVLPGWAWRITFNYRSKLYDVTTHDDIRAGEYVETIDHPNPALALVAAILSALIAEGDTHD